MAWMMAGSTLLATRTLPPTERAQHTSRRGVLAGKVPGLVAAEKTSGLDLGGRAPGELLVKVDDALHAEGIGGGTNSLHGSNCQPVSSSVLVSRSPRFPDLPPVSRGVSLSSSRCPVPASFDVQAPQFLPSSLIFLRINRCDVPWARPPATKVSNRPAPRTAVMHRPWGG